MLKGNIKLLIYDLLNLIDNENYESDEEIERRLCEGELITYLLGKYKMPYFSKTNVQEVDYLLKEKVGCSESNYKNGLIYLIEILLDC